MGWVYKEWQTAFERYPVNKDSILIGHSCGAGFLLRWLSENKVSVKRVVLVAPWIDPYKEKREEFFSFYIDTTLPLRTDLHLLHSDNDMTSVQESVRIITTALPGSTLTDRKNKMFSILKYLCGFA